METKAYPEAPPTFAADKQPWVTSNNPSMALDTTSGETPKKRWAQFPAAAGKPEKVSRAVMAEKATTKAQILNKLSAAADTAVQSCPLSLCSEICAGCRI